MAATVSWGWLLGGLNALKKELKALGADSRMMGVEWTPVILALVTVLVVRLLLSSDHPLQDQE